MNKTNWKRMVGLSIGFDAAGGETGAGLSGGGGSGAPAGGLFATMGSIPTLPLPAIPAEGAAADPG